jgi:hypothetical protein
MKPIPPSITYPPQLRPAIDVSRKNGVTSPSRANSFIERRVYGTQRQPANSIDDSMIAVTCLRKAVRSLALMHSCLSQTGSG